MGLVGRSSVIRVTAVPSFYLRYKHMHPRAVEIGMDLEGGELEAARIEEVAPEAFIVGVFAELCGPEKHAAGVGQNNNQKWSSKHHG